MERDGDVVTEFNNCTSQNYTLGGNTFSTGKYKMCKDDIVKPLFCMSDCLVSDVIMESEHNASKKYIESDSSKSDMKFPGTGSSFTKNEDPIISMIQKSEDVINNCIFPAWETTSQLCGFSPSPQKIVDKLHGQDSFINGSKLPIMQSNSSQSEFCSESNTKITPESSLNLTSDNLLLDYEADTSSSSIEELFCPPKVDFEEAGRTYAERHHGKLADEISLCDRIPKCEQISLDSQNLSSNPNFSSSFHSEVGIKYGTGSPQKNDRVMPQLIPTVICLDDDEPLPHDSKKTNCEVIDVADSPEMPTLIPFTSEVDEAFRIKVEQNGNEKRKLFDSDSLDSTSEIRQPQVILRRLSLDHCHKSQSEQDHGIVEQLAPQEVKKSTNEGPEIEEIEGVRFFQFRSKQEMEEFNKKPEKKEVDMDMIVPTKTTDITQIKGWRNKYFAPEAHFQPQIVNSDEIKVDDSSQDDKRSVMQIDEQSQDKKQYVLKGDSVSKSPEIKSPEKNEYIETDVKLPSFSPIEEKEEKPQPLKSEEILLTKASCDEKNPMSAFISEELDKYLLNSSALNVSLLEKVNPNIIPIPADSPILSLGKLRKTETNLNTSLKKKKPFVYKVKEDSPDYCDPIITLGDSPAPVITLDSSEESSTDDDVPVGKLYGTKKRASHVDNSENDGPTSKIHTMRKREIPIVNSDDDAAISKVYPMRKREIHIYNSDDDDASASRLYGMRRKVISADNKQVSHKYPKRRRMDLKQDNSTHNRLVLRLTKDGKGSSEGYKVSDISCKKLKDEVSCVSSSASESEEEIPDSFKMPKDGTLPVIKETIFLKEDEPRLLDEFLNNLNMYGTRKDVAMLVQSNQSYFDMGPALTVAHCNKAVSVLFSNSSFTEFKQKSKTKKKLKPWEKYLPKKLSSGQKMKFARSKCNVKSEEVASSTERCKRSIRLPARYLDSAVLAAGTGMEWVSPVITIDDSPNKKIKKQLSETNEKNKIEQNKIHDTETSSSSDDNSISRHVEIPGKISSSKNALEKKSTSVVESSEDPLPKPKRKLKSSNSQDLANTLKDENSKNQKPASSRKNLNSNSVYDVLKCLVRSDEKLYPLPVCFCTPCSRTVMFKKATKEFCCSCESIGRQDVGVKDQLLSNDKITLNCSNEYCQDVPGLDIKDSAKCKASDSSRILISEAYSYEDVKKSDSGPILPNKDCSNSDITLAPSDIVANEPKKTDSLGSNASLLSTYSIKNSQTSGKVSPVLPKIESYSSIYLNSLYPSGGIKPSFPAQEKNQSPLNEGAGSSSVVNVPANMSNKVILLLPVKPVGNFGSPIRPTAVPILPKANSPEKVEKCLINPDGNPKCKPSILIRTSGKFPASVADSAKCLPISECNVITSKKGGVLPSLAHTSTQRNVPCASPLTFRLPKIATDNAESNVPGVQTAALTVNSAVSTEVTNCPAVNVNDKNQSVGSTHSPVSLPNSAFNNLNSQKVQMKAYKVGDRVLLYSSLMQGNEVNPKCNSANVAVSSSGTVQPKGIPFTNVQPCVSPLPLPKTLSLETLPTSYKVLHNGLRKCTVVNKRTIENAAPQVTESGNRDSSPSSQSQSLQECHNYHKRRISNRKSPLSKRRFREESDVDIDIDTVDTDFDALSELRNSLEVLSDTDVSDEECDNIFTSSPDHLDSLYQKKTLKERKRRFLIKSGFENLKACSESFKGAKSCQEILKMASFVVRNISKKETALQLAKRRLELHNMMLLKKLIGTFESLEKPVKDIVKIKCMKKLAKDWAKCKQRKGNRLPSLLPKEHEAKPLPSFNMGINRTSVAVCGPDIGIKKESEVNKNSTENISSHVLSETPQKHPASNELSKFKHEDKLYELKKILNSPQLNVDASMNVNHISSSSPKADISKLSDKLRLDTMKKKIEVSLSRNNIYRENSSPSSECSSGETSTDDEPLVIDLSDDSCAGTAADSTPTKSADIEVKSEPSTDSEPKSNEQKANEAHHRKYAGVASFFHPVTNDVIKNTLHTVSQSSVGESSPIKESEGPQNLFCNQIANYSEPDVNHQNFLDLKCDEVINFEEESGLAKVTAKSTLLPSPANASSVSNSVLIHSSEDSPNQELSKVARTAAQLFGPCTVQKLQLKNGKTVFAYEQQEGSKLSPLVDINSNITARHSLPLSLAHSANNVKSLNDVFHAIDSISKMPSSQTKQILPEPEEITIEDSDDEVQEMEEKELSRSSNNPSFATKVSPVCQIGNAINMQETPQVCDSNSLRNQTAL